jgi:hypothetical protein
MKKYISIFIITGCILAFALVSCNLSGETSEVSIALTQTAASMALSKAEQQQAKPGVALAQEVLPLEQQIQTAIALTQQAAGSSAVVIEPQILTAIAQTQAAMNKNPLTDEQIQTAIAQLQIFSKSGRLSDQQIQIAIQQTQTALAAMGGGAAPQDPIAAGLTQTQQAMALLSSSNPGNPFANAYVYSYSFLRKYVYMLTIQLSGQIQGDYRAVVGGEDYKCEIVAAHPDRLYCNGPSVKGGNQTVSIYEGSNSQPVFSGDMVLPQWTPTRTRKPTDWVIYKKGEPTATITPKIKIKK